MSVLQNPPAPPSIPNPGSNSDLEEAQRQHYNRVYSALKPEKLARDAMDPAFFAYAVEHHTSWHGLYRGGFASRLRGKRVLELCAGSGLNALIMTRLGAEVTAFEISDVACERLAAAARLAGLSIQSRSEDFLETALESFDFVVGKACLHHLTQDTEDRWLAKIAACLDRDGEARFVEPAVNSRLLDSLRWLIPAPSRPSALQRTKFREWKANDPHPDRPCSTKHFREAGRRYFDSVHVEPFAGLKRIERLFRDQQRRDAVGRRCLQLERRLLPVSVARVIARTQLIVLREPKR